MKHGLITRIALAGLGVLLFSRPLAAQSYWLPSADLIAKARQTELIKPFIEAQCENQGAGTYVESVKWSGNPAADVQTVTHVIHRKQVSTMKTETSEAITYTYYGTYDEKMFVESEELHRALELLGDVLDRAPHPCLRLFPVGGAQPVDLDGPRAVLFVRADVL